MPLEFWIAIAGQVIVIVGVAVRLEHRITRVETDVRWLIGRRRQDQGRTDEPH